MKFLAKKKFFFLLFFLLVNFKASSNNIATINIEYILKNNIQYSQYIEIFSNYKSDLDTKLAIEEQNILEQKKEIEDLGNILTSEEIDKKILIYNTNVNNFSLKVENYNNIFNKNFQENKQIIMNKIYDISRDIALKKNFSLILSEQNYFISSQNIEISDLIITKLEEIKFDFNTVNIEGLF